MKRRRTPSPKRRIRTKRATAADWLRSLGAQAKYGGNPEHKRNPGDFGLDPPSLPRQGKSLCDYTGVLTKADALALLKEGFQRGLVSVQERNGWPQNVWAVTKLGLALEAMLENRGDGTYHGYPMLEDDPLAEEVLERWDEQ